MRRRRDGCGKILACCRTRHVLRSFGGIRQGVEILASYGRAGDDLQGRVPAAALAGRGRARQIGHSTRRCAPGTSVLRRVAFIRSRRRGVQRCGGRYGRRVGGRPVRWKLTRRRVAFATAGWRGDWLESHANNSRACYGGREGGGVRRKRKQQAGVWRTGRNNSGWRR